MPGSRFQAPSKGKLKGLFVVLLGVDEGPAISG